jgi:hypothetical protein
MLPLMGGHLDRNSDDSGIRTMTTFGTARREMDPDSDDSGDDSVLVVPALLMLAAMMTVTIVADYHLVVVVLPLRHCCSLRYRASS